jgi:hypothetical protein
VRFLFGKAALLRSHQRKSKAALLRSPIRKSHGNAVQEEDMKYRIIATLVASLLLSLPGWAATDANSGFASLKNLAGQWKAKDEKGNPAITTWKLVSGGSALMEEMPHESMVTMYHLDNDRLLMTHY